MKRRIDAAIEGIATSKSYMVEYSHVSRVFTDAEALARVLVLHKHHGARIVSVVESHADLLGDDGSCEWLGAALDEEAGYDVPLTRREIEFLYRTVAAVGRRRRQDRDMRPDELERLRENFFTAITNIETEHMQAE